jgi:hypothetical protein
VICAQGCGDMCIGIVRKDGVICAQECGDMCIGIVRKDGVICAQECGWTGGQRVMVVLYCLWGGVRIRTWV